MIIGFIALLVVEILPLQLIGIFGASNESAYYTAFAVRCFRVYLCLLPLATLNKGTFIFLQAMGKAFASICITMAREIIFGVFLPILMPLIWGLDGVLYSFPAADILTFAIAFVVISKTYKELNNAPALATAATDQAEQQAIIRTSKPGVIVTISREHGSAGKQIGKRVAEKLSIPFYYKEMTALAAQEGGFHKEFISDINANSPEYLRTLYLSTEVVQYAMVAQEKVLRKIADAGSCVIVGRAANYVLQDMPQVVRVFIYAPAEYKVQKVMEMYGDSRQEAEQNIVRSTKARSAYYKAISGHEWDDPREYDLCIDGSMGMDAAAEVICAFVRQKEGQQ